MYIDLIQKFSVTGAARNVINLLLYFTIMTTSTSIKRQRGMLIVLCLVKAILGQTHETHMLSGRDVIVHLFEWRWEDIGNECKDYLGPAGFGGVQTSPVSENAIVDVSHYRPWWERYQPISYNITTRSGNTKDFAEMVARCNDVGVRVYVDLVLNHMTNKGVSPLTGTGGSIGYPNDRFFPAVPFLPEHFNRGCTISNITNPTEEEFRNCDLGDLVDLNQGLEYVREKIVNFLNELIDMGVAGFRIDAARHMWPDDLEIIYSRLHDLNTSAGFPEDSRAFFYHEVIDLGDSPIPPSDYFRMGIVTEFKYSNELGLTFSGERNLSSLATFGQAFMPNESALSFVDNHDNQRGHCGECSPLVLSYKKPRLYTMATAFHLAWKYGVPRIMSSFDFTDTEAGPPTDENANTLPVIINADGTCGNGWVCEHRWPAIKGMINFKAAVEGEEINNFWSNGGDQIAFCRGENGFIAFNNEQFDMNVTLQTCVPNGIYCDVISGAKIGGECSGTTVIVNADLTANIVISANADYGVLAIHKGTRL